MGFHTHCRPINSDRIRFPRLERRQHWMGRAELAVQTGWQHRPSRAHSKATQGASLPAQRHRALPHGERDAARHKQEMLRPSSGTGQNHALGRHLSGGSHTRYHGGESAAPSAWNHMSSRERATQNESTAQGTRSSRRAPALQTHPTGE